jgi:predicted RNase H-like nuclease (RuvC/YqgF family)
MAKELTLDEKINNIDAQLERIATAVIKGFSISDKKQETIRDELKQSIDIYARAVDAYAKQSETYMQEMLALSNKVDRLEKQIEQIAEHLNIKLAY